MGSLPRRKDGTALELLAISPLQPREFLAEQALAEGLPFDDSMRSGHRRAKVLAPSAETVALAIAEIPRYSHRQDVADIEALRGPHLLERKVGFVLQFFVLPRTRGSRAGAVQPPQIAPQLVYLRACREMLSETERAGRRLLPARTKVHLRVRCVPKQKPNGQQTWSNLPISKMS